MVLAGVCNWLSDALVPVVYCLYSCRARMPVVLGVAHTSTEFLVYGLSQGMKSGCGIKWKGVVP